MKRDTQASLPIMSFTQVSVGALQSAVSHLENVLWGGAKDKHYTTGIRPDKLLCKHHFPSQIMNLLIFDET